MIQLKAAGKNNKTVTGVGRKEQTIRFVLLFRRLTTAPDSIEFLGPPLPEHVRHQLVPLSAGFGLLGLLRGHGVWCTESWRRLVQFTTCLGLVIRSVGPCHPLSMMNWEDQQPPNSSQHL